MTNGIAVSKTNPIARDYWHNKTCSSGYSTKNTTSPLRRVLNRFILEGMSWGRDSYKDLWEEYSPLYVLAVPEQLVWWYEDE